MAGCNSISLKLSNAFNRCFFIVFTCLFIITGIGGAVSAGVFGELGNEYPMPVYITVLRVAALLLSFVLITFLILKVCEALQSGRAQKLDDRRFNTRFILIAVAIFLAIQLFCAFCLQMKPISDIDRLDTYAAKIVTDNSFDCLDSDFNGHYIIRYQNNLPLLLLYTLIYKLTYMICGGFSRIPIIIINTAAINAAVLLTVLTSRRIFGCRKAVLTLVICVLFTPYYTYTPYFYTDSFSLPLLAGAVYMFTCACQSQKRINTVLLLAACGALCFIGFEIKASIIILLIALMIYLPLKFGIKKALKSAAVILTSFAVLFCSYSLIIKNANLISEESSEKYQFPPAHWVMMGLKDFGAFNWDDSDFSMSFESKTERQNAAVEEIGKRISEKGFFGMIAHTGKKAVWTYMDGTYYIANYLEHYEHKTPLHEIVLYDGNFRFPFFVYSFGYQLFLIFMMGYSALSACRKKELSLTTLFRIAVFGMFIFFLIWETNARYPFNFTPLYILLATEGACAFSKTPGSRKIFAKKPHKKRGK